MVTFKSTFDRHRIEAPRELEGAAPGDILIVYLADDLKVAEPKRASMWDAVGKAKHQRSGQVIISDLRSERDGWDNS